MGEDIGQATEATPLGASPEEMGRALTEIHGSRQALDLELVGGDRRLQSAAEMLDTCLDTVGMYEQSDGDHDDHLRSLLRGRLAELSDTGNDTYYAVLQGAVVAYDNAGRSIAQIGVAAQRIAGPSQAESGQSSEVREVTPGESENSAAAVNKKAEELFKTLESTATSVGDATATSYVRAGSTTVVAALDRRENISGSGNLARLKEELTTERSRLAHFLGEEDAPPIAGALRALDAAIATLDTEAKGSDIEVPAPQASSVTQESSVSKILEEAFGPAGSSMQTGAGLGKEIERILNGTASVSSAEEAPHDPNIPAAEGSSSSVSAESQTPEAPSLETAIAGATWTPGRGVRIPNPTGVQGPRTQIRIEGDGIGSIPVATEESAGANLAEQQQPSGYAPTDYGVRGPESTPWHPEGQGVSGDTPGGAESGDTSQNQA